jgi:ubiquinone/menaquinone biosynthesis C-methylase UbiE
LLAGGDVTGAGREFDNLADGYDKHRPEYPDVLMKTIADHLEAGNHPDPVVVADVGAGTGIATRLLRTRLPDRYLVLGVEPGEGMRLQALASTPDEMGIDYIESTAEDLPFDDGGIAAVVVAQALQWFDRPRFYREVARVLRPGGTLAVLENNRDWHSSIFLDAWESFLEEQNPAYNRNYRAFDIQSELMDAGELNPDDPVVEIWDRAMSVEEFVGMAESSSRFQQVVERIGERPALERARLLATQHAADDGDVRVRYRSELYLARRD